MSHTLFVKGAVIAAVNNIAEATTDGVVLLGVVVRCCAVSTSLLLCALTCAGKCCLCRWWKGMSAVSRVLAVGTCGASRAAAWGRCSGIHRGTGPASGMAVPCLGSKLNMAAAAGAVIAVVLLRRAAAAHGMAANIVGCASEVRDCMPITTVRRAARYRKLRTIPRVQRS